MKSVVLLSLFLAAMFHSAAQTGDQQVETGEELTGTQEGTADHGEVSARIHTHFNWSLNRQDPSTTFEVKRAYFGYSRQLDQHFSGEVKLDIGSPDDVSEYSLIRRYTYFKNAYIAYSNGKFKSWFGLFDMLQFKLQEKFWDYRYIYRSYMDQYRFGPSADLGLGIQYRLSGSLTADVIISNGEGYQNLQFDDVYKVGTGITFELVEDLTIRGYYTVHTSVDPQMCLSGFVGYRLEKFRFAGECVLQKNYRFNKDHNRYGYSLYATYTLSDRWEFFARYDQVYSNILPEDQNPWNLADDGSAIVSGVQFKPVEPVRISFNYQDWVEYAQNGDIQPFVYLNFELNF
ncbi:MAG TPA: porin [Bacteroides sp.]|nr:porin [Bacteroides sp.]